MIKTAIPKIICTFLLAYSSCFNACASDESFVSAIKGRIKKGDTISVSDDKFLFTTLDQWNTINNKSVNNYISFGLRTDTAFYIPKPFACTLRFKIEYFSTRDQTSPQITEDIELTLRYDTATASAFPINALYSFSNAYRVKVIVDTVFSKELGKDIPEIFYIKNQIFIKRFYNSNNPIVFLKSISNAAKTANPNNFNVNSTGPSDNKLTVTWDELSVNGLGKPEEYDLEWIFIDMQNERGQFIKNGSPSGNNFNFDSTLIVKWMRFDNTRVNIKNGFSYTINTAYPEGYLIFRVRAVYYTDGVRWTSEWVYRNNVGYISCFLLNEPHEKYLNWQYNATFAEDAKRKDIISYFDGSLKSRQTVTINNSDKLAIISETIYDRMGRPAVNVLPAPTDNNSPTVSWDDDVLKYYKNFNLNSLAAPKAYSSDDLGESFETTGSTITSCSITTSAMSNNSGASKYYSPANWMALNPSIYPDKYFAAYIPSANINPSDSKGYPFSVTEYTPDETGRIKSQGGVGPHFQIGTEHETKFFYGKPTQEQLDRLFGVEAGDASHFLKNMVVDPNGQISVSYLNASGKTVATALAGISPLNTDTLPGASSAKIQSLEQEILHEQDFSANTTSLILEASSVFLAENRGAYHFKSKLLNAAIGPFPKNIGSSFCTNCYYEISVEVKNDCGDVVAAYTGSTFNGADIQCHEKGFQLPSIEFNIQAEKVGEYFINYKVQLKKDTIKKQEDYYINNNSSLKNINWFFIEELNKVVLSGCFSECHSCIEKIGSKFDFQTKMMAVIQSFGSEKFKELSFDPLNPDILIWIDTTYDNILAQCMSSQANCPKSVCDERLQQIKFDVLPGGQYARYENSGVYGIPTEDMATSVFKDYKTNPKLINYQFIANDGTIKNIKDSGVGFEEFIIQYHQHPEWADGFALLHPEYCYYLWCEAKVKTEEGVFYDNESSFNFDRKIKLLTGGAAIEKGYYSIDDIYNGFNKSLILLNQDPFFNGYGFGNSYRTLMENDILSISQVLNINLIDVEETKLLGTPTFVTDNYPKGLKEYVEWLVYGQVKPNGIIDNSTDSEKYAISVANMWKNLVVDVECRVPEKEWPLFRNLYLNLKMKYVELVRIEYFRSLKVECTNCYIGTDIVSTTAPEIELCINKQSSNLPLSLCKNDTRYNDYKQKIRLFRDYINFEPINRCLKEIVPEFSGDINEQITQALENQNNSHIKLINQNLLILEEMKAAWKNKLKSVRDEEFYNVVSLTNILIDELIEKLFNVSAKSIEIADPQNMRPASTLPPGIFSIDGYNSFYEVFNAVVGTALMSQGFSHHLIEYPYPYDKQPFEISPIIAEIDSALCQNINVLKDRFKNSGFSGTFHDYLKQELKENYILTENELQEILNKCASKCKLLKKDMQVPVAFVLPFVSNPDHPFTNCKRINDLMSDFNGIYGQIDPNSKLYRLLFTNYFNHALGYALTFYDYSTFINDCAKISPEIVLYNKPISPIILLGEFQCINDAMAGVFETAAQLYDIYIEKEREKFRANYVLKCLSNIPTANITGDLYEYHYTLYYYDQSGNLVKTVPPEGVELIKPDELSLVKTFRNEDPSSLNCSTDGFWYETNPANIANKMAAEFDNTQGKALEFWLYKSPSSGDPNMRTFRIMSPSRGPGKKRYMVQAAVYNSKLWVEIHTFEEGPAGSGQLTLIRTNHAFTSVSHLPSLQSWTHLFIQSPTSIPNGNDLEIFLDGRELTISQDAPPYPFEWNFSATTSAYNLPPNDYAVLKHLRLYKRIATAAEVWANYINSCLTPKGLLANYYGSVSYDINNEPLHFWGRFNMPLAPGGETGIGDGLDEYANRFIVPNHRLTTNYYYNSFNQIIKQTTPDAGLTEFWYDRLGRMVISQNEEQKTPSNPSEPVNRYSYTRYDELGRIVEVGERFGVLTEPTEEEVRKNTFFYYDPASPSPGWLNEGNIRQVTITAYDELPHWMDPLSTSCFCSSQQVMLENLRKRVSATILIPGPVQGYEVPDDLIFHQRTSGTYYSYDIAGNVKELIQENKSLQSSEAAAFSGSDGLKRVEYDYDQISGKVNLVKYQRGKWDQFFYWYTYDAENRLTGVYSSRKDPALTTLEEDDVVWKREAYYRYYPHGPLARMQLGRKGMEVQGLDYAYTLQGWLKGVNGTFLNNESMPFKEGYTSSNFSQFGRDAFAYSLGYHSNDYTPVNIRSAAGYQTKYTAPILSAGIITAETGKELFNGNISYATYGIMPFDNGATIGYTYRYDQLNRLTAMRRHSTILPGNNWNNSSIITAYKEDISYDANGNILTYKRNGNQPTGNFAMDDLVYNYNRTIDGKLLNNKLKQVNDNPSYTAYYAEDVDNQTHPDNYVYDKVGNLIEDKAEGIGIEWTVYGKIKTVWKSNGDVIQYGYDAGGNRITKKVKPAGAAAHKTTWYVRDAQGNLLSTYSQTANIPSPKFEWEEQHLYGSSRLGLLRPAISVYLSAPKPHANYNDTMDVSGDIGRRVYELTNHLGNVMATISDKRLSLPDLPACSLGCALHYEAEILSAQDYYSFGAIMPGRSYNAGDYRYGFNGKENDNEVKGEGNQQDYGMRIYDPKVGRFLSVDPLQKQFPSLSSYQYSGNNPIATVDLDGLEPAAVNPGTEALVLILQGYGGNPPDNNTQASNAAKTKPNLGADEALGNIRSSGTKLQVVVYASSQTDNTKTDVLTTIKNFRSINPNGKVILVGHSGGADNIVELAKENKDIKINLMITLDVRDPKQLGWTDTNIPSNVENAINYYQNTDNLNLVSDRKMDFSKKTNGVNILSPGSNHRSIDNDQVENVIKDINNALLNRNPVEQAKNRAQPLNDPKKSNSDPIPKISVVSY